MSTTFACRVVAWQATHGRHDLPWQHTRDPYRVWLSEIMLQQTQVGTVAGYYDRFLARFPDLHALARASQDDVLAAWSGLGYYSRARNLHRCANSVVREHGGRFPTTSRELARLPGIGASTAAAIAAFCFGERAAILDGNVKRVLARWLGFGADLTRAGNVRDLWRIAHALLSSRDVERYSQGLMDLGATVCTARVPKCERCPVAADCVARRAGAIQSYPVKAAPPARTRRQSVWFWLRFRDQVWLECRPERGVWAGLWSLPEFATFSDLADATRGWPGAGEALPAIDHALSHFDWRLYPRRWTLPTSAPDARVESWLAGRQPGHWRTREAALTLGIPAPLRRLLV